MENNKPDAIARQPKRAVLNWVDFLVIAATALTFLAVVMANNPHAARAQSRMSILSESDLPAQDREAPLDPGLIRAGIGLTLHRL